MSKTTELRNIKINSNPVGQAPKLYESGGFQWPLGDLLQIRSLTLANPFISKSCLNTGQNTMLPVVKWAFSLAPDNCQVVENSMKGGKNHKFPHMSNRDLEISEVINVNTSSGMSQRAH